MRVRGRHRRVPRHHAGLVGAVLRTTTGTAYSKDERSIGRQVPVELDTTTRARVLAGWAIISTPLLLASLALMFLSSGTGLVLLGGGALLLVFMLEAIARRHLAEFIFTAAWVTLTVFVLAIIVASLVTRWRLTVGAVFVTAAAVVLVLNVRELRRR